MFLFISYLLLKNQGTALWSYSDWSSRYTMFQHPSHHQCWRPSVSILEFPLPDYLLDRHIILQIKLYIILTAKVAFKKHRISLNAYLVFPLKKIKLLNFIKKCLIRIAEKVFLYNPLSIASWFGLGIQCWDQLPQQNPVTGESYLPWGGPSIARGCVTQPGDGRAVLQ